MPRVRLAPRAVDSLADEAIALAAGYGLVADDWQAEVVEDWLLVRRTGRYACMTCGLSVARQNGKNAIIEIRELYGMIALGEKFLHTAHEVKTARKAFKRLKYFFGEKVNDPGAKFPELNALVEEIRSTNGQEAIVLKNGGSVEFVARSKGSGRGFTVDVLVCDEAQDLTDEELEALLPTISAAPLGNPQIIFTGTPPNPEKNQTGEVFTRVRNDGVTGADRALSWTDFGVPDGPLEELDLDDRDTLYATNPGLVSGRLQETVCATERRRLSSAGYARERFGWWGDPAEDVTSRAIDLEAWAKRADPGARKPKGSVVLAVDVNPDRSRAAIAVAGRGRGKRTLVMVRTGSGTGWVIPELQRLLEKREVSEVCLHPGGQAGSLIPELVEAGIEYEALKTSEMSQACAAFIEAVKRDRLVHLGQPELDEAVRGARTRQYGRSETELFDRRETSAEISPLVAASAAAFRLSLQGGEDYDVMDSIY